MLSGGSPCCSPGGGSPATDALFVEHLARRCGRPPAVQRRPNAMAPWQIRSRRACPLPRVHRTCRSRRSHLPRGPEGYRTRRVSPPLGPLEGPDAGKSTPGSASMSSWTAAECPDAAPEGNGSRADRQPDEAGAGTSPAYHSRAGLFPPPNNGQIRAMHSLRRLAVTTRGRRTGTGARIAKAPVR